MFAASPIRDLLLSLPVLAIAALGLVACQEERDVFDTNPDVAAERERADEEYQRQGRYLPEEQPGTPAPGAQPAPTQPQPRTDEPGMPPTGTEPGTEGTPATPPS